MIHMYSWVLRCNFKLIKSLSFQPPTLIIPQACGRVSAHHGHHTERSSNVEKSKSPQSKFSFPFKRLLFFLGRWNVDI